MKTLLRRLNHGSREYVYRGRDPGNYVIKVCIKEICCLLTKPQARRSLGSNYFRFVDGTTTTTSCALVRTPSAIMSISSRHSSVCLF